MLRNTLMRPLVCGSVAVLCLVATPVTQAYDDYRPSAVECDAYARNEATRSGSFLGGAARGAVGGAALGAIVGGKRKDARRGARIGAAVGGVSRASRRNRERSRAYDDCMSGRGRY